MFRRHKLEKKTLLHRRIIYYKRTRLFSSNGYTRVSIYFHRYHVQMYCVILLRRDIDSGFIHTCFVQNKPCFKKKNSGRSPFTRQFVEN